MNLCIRNSRSLLSRLPHRAPVHLRQPSAYNHNDMILPCRPTILGAIESRLFRRPHAVPDARGYCTSLWSPISNLALRNPTSRGGTGSIAGYRRGFHIETVPYINRTHLVTCYPEFARELSEIYFTNFKKEHASKIIHHPDYERVRRIVSKIVHAVPRGLTIKNHTSLDWVDKLNWEVLFLRDDKVGICCLSGGGKIVIHGAFFDQFSSNDEIAFFVAHEVGHVIARQCWEMIRIFPNLLLTPILRRDELEADHIGIMVLASAGFDPHMAPQVMDKLGKITGESAFRNVFSSISLDVHPSCKKRSELLSQPKVMENAMELYRQATNVGTQGHDKV